MLVKALFEFSSSKGFELPDTMLTHSKQTPPAAKAKAGGTASPSGSPQPTLKSKSAKIAKTEVALASVRAHSDSCSSRSKAVISTICALTPSDPTNALQDARVVIMQELAYHQLLKHCFSFGKLSLVTKRYCSFALVKAELPDHTSIAIGMFA